MNRFMQSFLYAYQSEAGEEEKPAGGDAPKTFTAEEVQAAIAAAVEAEVAGLKAKTDELLAEKKAGDKRRQEAEEARKLAEQKAMKEEGRFDEFEKTIRGQYDPLIAERDARLSAMQNRILSSEQKAVIGSLVGDFIDPSAADVLGLLVRTEFEGDEVVTKFAGADGKVITTDPAQFKKYLREHKAFSHLLKADAASGGGAGGSKGGGAANNFSEMSEAERIELYNKNPAEFERQMKLQRGK